MLRLVDAKFLSEDMVPDICHLVKVLYDALLNGVDGVHIEVIFNRFGI